MKKILCLLLLCLSSSLSWAGVIPKAYDYVTLPANTIDTRYSFFTAINSRGLAIGFGSRNAKSMTFVYNYYTKTVVHIIDDLFPSSINDHNKIVGMDFTSPNFAFKQCTLDQGQCVLTSIEGAERAFLPADGLTNSDVMVGNFFVNTPEQKYQIYQFGKLLLSESVTGTLPNTELLMKGVQKNNTTLFVGARKTANTNFRPIVKERDFTGIKELNLPIPANVTASDKVIASNVNSRNEIILHVELGIDSTEIYRCAYIGDNDGDGVAECAGGLKLINAGLGLQSSTYPSPIEQSNIPVNDHGLMLAPAQRNGEPLRFYDLNQENPVAVPLTDFGDIGVFFNAFPMEVENNGAVLVRAVQTVIFVPIEEQQLVVDTSYPNEPIVLGPEGGRLQGFIDRIENTSSETKSFYIWRALISPQGIPFPVGRTSAISLDAGEIYEYTRSRTSLRSSESSGEYRYVFYVKNKDTSEVFSDEVRIIKQP